MKFDSDSFLRRAAIAARALLILATVASAVTFAVRPAVAAKAEDGHAAGGHGGGAHGEAAHGEPSPLMIGPDLALFTGIIFLVLLGVLGKFAWGPIRDALEAREKAIADNIAAAEARNDEAKRLLAEYDKRLAGAADRVRELLEEARRDAEHTKGEIVAEAKKAAQAEHERAMRDVRNATDAALKELAETSANLAVGLAGRIVQKQLTPDDPPQLIREAMSKPPAEPSRN